MAQHLEKLISQGEHEHQDFKYCISDARKIARTLSAFANSGGGRLLVGVRDNGSIAGIESEEEYYMVESAAKLYCKPEIRFSAETHRRESKSVIEFVIKEGDKKPYLASTDEGRWMAYVRIKDQNLLANKVILNIWKLQAADDDLLIEFSQAETALVDYLKSNPYITLSTFKKISGLSKFKAEWVLAKLILLGILQYDLNKDGCKYLPLSPL